MKSLQILGGVSVLALAISGCSTWDQMGHDQKSTTVGAASGAVAGAAVGGPVGAVAGAGIGGVAGHELAKDSQKDLTASTDSSRYSTSGSSSPSTASTSSYPSSASASTSRQTTQSAQSGTSNSSSTATASANGRTNTPAGTTGSMSSGMSNPDLQHSAANSTQPYVSSSMGSATNTVRGSNSPSTVGTEHSMSGGSADIGDPSFVRSVQQALNSKGFSAGMVDGKMGPHTEAAIRKFQNAKGLQATGQLDSATVAALGISQPYESSTTGSTGPNTASNRAGSAGLNTTTASSNTTSATR